MTESRGSLRVVTGVDGSKAAGRALDLFGRLSFAPPVEQSLINVVEPFAPLAFGGVPYDWRMIERLLTEAERLGREALEAARFRATTSSSPEPTALQRTGDPTEAILQLAAERRADLVVVGAADSPLWDRVARGSVHRNLLHMAPCSVLLGRESELPERPLKAVFATDHSDYSQRTLSLLARLQPRGIGQLAIVTAYPQRLTGALSQALGTHEADELSTWIEERLRALNTAAERALAPLGCAITSTVSAQTPVVAVCDALEEHEADLLIVSARGKRFFERLTVGSVSQQLLHNTTRHVLLLRSEQSTESATRHYEPS